jgi:hypothetical protein
MVQIRRLRGDWYQATPIAAAMAMTAKTSAQKLGDAGVYQAAATGIDII